VLYLVDLRIRWKDQSELEKRIGVFQGDVIANGFQIVRMELIDNGYRV